MSHDRPPSASRCQPPPRHKLALLTFVGLVAPVYFIPPLLAAVLPWSRLAIVLSSLALIVPLMTYVILPALKWLVGGYVWASRLRQLCCGQLRHAGVGAAHCTEPAPNQTTQPLRLARTTPNRAL